MAEAETVRAGGIVLCGGKSTRMGRSKAWLPFGEETMLQRVVRILEEVVSPIVVVAARGQDLPPLPQDTQVARDEQEDPGPLGGLAVGLSTLRKHRIEKAYVSSCDSPLLKPAFVHHLLEVLGDHELAVTKDGKYYHPLAAVYRTGLEDRIRELIAEKRMRPLFLIEKSDAIELDVEQLRSVDPDLDSLRNTNTPEEYRSALEAAGISSP